MSKQLSPDIRNQLQKLAEKDAFADSIDEFVNNAITVLCSNEATHNEQTCPTALILAFSHCYCNNLPLSTLAVQLPEQIRTRFVDACDRYSLMMPPMFKEEGVEELSDVHWSIDIAQGRELWNIVLLFQSGNQVRLLLNYEQLSVLVFKIGQALTYAQNYQV